MTTAPTDTGKRLSDDAVAAIIQNEMGRYLSVDKDGEIDGAGPASYSAARLILERLSTPPSQGKVERAREFLALAYESHTSDIRHIDRVRRGIGSVPVVAAIAAITQALTERGTDGSTE